jgi:hypothetical protein
MDPKDKEARKTLENLIAKRDVVPTLYSEQW